VRADEDLAADAVDDFLEAPAVVVEELDAVIVAVLDGAQAVALAFARRFVRLGDVAEQVPVAVVDVDAIAPRFAAEHPAPRSDGLLADLEEREVDGHALGAPHGDPPALDDELPAEGVAPAEAHSGVAVGHFRAVGALDLEVDEARKVELAD